MLKKNDYIQAECIGYTNDGHGVVKVDGFPLFVKGMLEGEVGELVVTLVKKTYGYARLLKIVKQSIHRIEPICPVAKICGGCQLQHMSYEESLRFKKQKVQDVMTRIAKLPVVVEDVLGMDKYTYYRNKGQIPVGMKGNDVLTGFYRINSHDIIDINSCMIQSERINEVLQVMKQLLQKYKNVDVFRHVLIKDGFHTKEVMVVWIVRKMKFAYRQEMMEELVQLLPYIKTVVVNLNTRDDNVILGDKEEVLYGKGYITDKLQDFHFRISSKSFYQVNPVQTEVLYGKALEFCQLTGKETVLDLYCGVGTISMFLAKQAKQVVGIEIVEQAVKNASENALENGLHNVVFVCSDAASYASKLSKEDVRPDVIVVDPPRKGCDQVTIDSIVQMAPKRVVYVSCDPATLARDLHIFDEKGYYCVKVQPVDMFPFSHHVENVVLLERNFHRINK